MTTTQTGFDGMTWLNEPPAWAIRDGALAVTTGDRTDFWRETFYGFVRDDGHVLHRAVEGDFSAEVTLSGGYAELYDQSGLMLRVDEERWVKTGIELTDGAPHLSAVVTNRRSDWSVAPLPGFAGSLRIRLTRLGSAVLVHFLDGDAWRLFRVAFLPAPEVCSVGVMCCSPERAGFEARFDDFVVGPAG